MVPRLAVILPTMFLVAIGLVMVYSSSSIVSFVEEGDSSGEALKQVLFAVIGTIAAVAAYRFATQNNLRGKIGWGYYFVCIALLILTPLVGSEALGATRWIRIGPVGIQASEFLKIALVVAMALIAEEYATGRIDVLDAIKRVGLLIVVPLLFLYLTQSDLGTTMICFVGLFTVLVCAGLPRSIIVAMALFAVLFVVISVVATGYRSDRMIFLDPWSDPDDKGYQLIHSFQAIASGGFFGTGVGNSYEKLQYLPEAETDFIFAIICEELGFVGGAGVIVAFVILAYGGMRIASKATSPFGSFVAAGLVAMLIFQAFLNIACVVGCAPTTGKPLPFISSGGSSMISSLLLVGVVLAISFDSHNEGEYRQRRDNLRVVSRAAQGDAPERGAERVDRGRSRSLSARRAYGASSAIRVLRRGERRVRPTGAYGEEKRVLRRSLRR